MLEKLKIQITMAAVVLAVFGLGVKSSYADGPRHGDRWGGHHHSFSRDIVSFDIGGFKFFYSDGYNHRPRYVETTVRRLPSCYRPVIINGVTYYTDKGVYYLYTPYGYQLVEQPVAYVQTAPVVVTPSVPVQVRAAANTFNGDDLYMVNVPNDRNGYTSVTVKKAGNGFVGPQGEYYSEFPTVAQLKAMYVR